MSKKEIEKMLPRIYFIAQDIYSIRLSKKRIQYYLDIGSDYEKDDLIQEAVICAVKALEKYDPRKSSIETFLSQRIFGAMIDALRDNKLFGNKKNIYNREFWQ